MIRRRATRESSFSGKEIGRQVQTAEIINECCSLHKHVIKLHHFQFLWHYLGEMRLDHPRGNQALCCVDDAKINIVAFKYPSLKQKIENESHSRFLTPRSQLICPNLQRQFSDLDTCNPGFPQYNTKDLLKLNIWTYLDLIFSKPILSLAKRNVDL